MVRKFSSHTFKWLLLSRDCEYVRYHNTLPCEDALTKNTIVNYNLLQLTVVNYSTIYFFHNTTVFFHHSNIVNHCFNAIQLLENFSCLAYYQFLYIISFSFLLFYQLFFGGSNLNTIGFFFHRTVVILQYQTTIIFTKFHSTIVSNYGKIQLSK